MFLVAFFLKKIGGSAVFWAAVAAQAVVGAIYFYGKAHPAHELAYLWLNPIGCVTCVVFAAILQTLRGSDQTAQPA